MAGRARSCTSSGGTLGGRFSARTLDIARRVAGSHKVQTLLFKLGIRERPARVNRIEHPALSPHLRPLVAARGLWVNSRDPLSHFLRWPFEYRAYLTLLCGLRTNSSILELGCNHGRTMLGLVDYLRAPGRYEGLDIMPRQIAFAQQEIHSRWPIFNFTLADVHSAHYNPTGRLDAETYRFPYPDRSFDVVYACSLFTHLLPAATANYFRESRRVLRPGGRCLFSFLLLDGYRKRGVPTYSYRFEYPVEGYGRVAAHDPKVPEKVIAYEASLVHDMAEEADLKVERMLPGFWSDAHELSVNEQDMFLLAAKSE